MHQNQNSVCSTQLSSKISTSFLLSNSGLPSSVFSRSKTSKKRTKTPQKLSSKAKHLINQKAKSLYYYSKKEVLLSTDHYEIIGASLRSTKQKKIAKIYNKKKINLKRNLLKKVKNEIYIHQELHSSECILNAEAIFETKNHLYIIYEDCQIFSLEDLIKYVSYDKMAMKRYLSIILIGLAEINSLSLSVGFLDASMLVLCPEMQTIKLFNFGQILPYGQNSSNLLKNLQKRISEFGVKHPDMGKRVDLRTDSWSFGMIMAIFLKNSSRVGGSNYKGRMYFEEISEDPGLSEEEKDLLKGCLANQKVKRLALNDIFVHDYFSGLFMENKQNGAELKRLLNKTEKGADKNLESKITEIKQFASSRGLDEIEKIDQKEKSNEYDRIKEEACQPNRVNISRNWESTSH
jgi:serine/threonine protein kinase